MNNRTIAGPQQLKNPPIKTRTGPRVHYSAMCAPGGEHHSVEVQLLSRIAKYLLAK